MRFCLLLPLMLLFSIQVAFAQYESCTDSDGISYDATGKVTLINAKKQTTELDDYCSDDKAKVDDCKGEGCYANDYSCAKGKADWNFGLNQKRCIDIGYQGCTKGACTGTLKPKETCSDNIQNQDERDIDCGGICGATCKLKQRCEKSSDCARSNCESGICSELISKKNSEKLEPTCSDGIINRDEEAVDCGGKYCKSCLTIKTKEMKNKDKEENKEMEKAAVKPATAIKELSCKDSCYQAYGKHKILYSQCVEQKCSIVPKTEQKETQMYSKKIQMQRSIVVEPTKKIEISKEKLTVDGAKTDNKTIFVKIKDKEIKLAKTKSGISLKEPNMGAIGAESDAPLIYEKGKLFGGNSKKEINVFPSDIKRKLSGIESIKIVDEDSPKYIVKTKTKKKLFGLIPLSASTNYQISAESWQIINEERPFWHFFATDIRPSYAGDGDFCWLNFENIDNPDPQYVCDEGLRCENVLATSDTIGKCRLYPAAFHGKLVYVWDDWEDLEGYFERANWDDAVPRSEVNLWVSPTEDGLEIPFYKWLEWFERANDVGIDAYFVPLELDGDLIEIDESFLDEDGYFEVRYMDPSKYYIGSRLIVDGEEGFIEFWEFSVNGGQETMELNLCEDRYNGYNKINMLAVTPALPISPPPPPLTLDGEYEEYSLCG